MICIVCALQCVDGMMTSNSTADCCCVETPHESRLHGWYASLVKATTSYRTHRIEYAKMVKSEQFHHSIYKEIL